MFSSLRSIVYRVPDLAAANDWYERVLGKAPVFDSPIAVTFAVGETLLSLTPAGSGAPAAGMPNVIAYWGVEDIEEAHKALLELGATARGEIITTVIKTRAATLVDPFGNVFGITGKPVAPKTSTERPSASALGVTLFRAFATRDARAEIRGHDELAEIFLPAEYRTMLDNPAARDWAIAKAPGSYEFFLGRTAFFDEIVGQALDENAPQLVWLGAGYDSRAYRFADRIRDTLLFEVDLPSTQQRKKTMLQQAGVAVPESLAFVPVDLTREALGEALRAAGFDPARRTLYVWEGVCYYLPAEAVDATLSAVRDISPAGSELCFDYMVDAPDMAIRYGVAQSQALMRDAYQAEPVRFRIAEGSLAAFLSERGYLLKEHLTAEEQERTFLTLSNGEIAGRVLACFGLARAVVEK